MQADLGFAHFLTHADGVATFLLTVLALMSIATWYLIVQKSAANWRMKRRRQDFLAMFWDAADLDAVAAYVHAKGIRDPFSHLTHHGLKAADQYRNNGPVRKPVG